jgi:predicted dehydrogenase
MGSASCASARKVSRWCWTNDAVVNFRHDRTHPVLLTHGGRTEPLPLPSATAYERQAVHFIEQVAGLEPGPPRATMADAVAVTRVLEWEAGMLQDRT